MFLGNRKPLDPQTALTFQGRTFYTESLADRGSNALVYRGRQEIPDGSHPVLIRELRRKMRRNC